MNHRRPPQDRVPDPDTLLAWYDRHRRRLPWRALPGERADPYHVWLSEIMLQQTTVATVAPYFTAFLDRWPTVRHLAGADLDAVLHAWAGLGYYARARNLHRCAQVVVEAHDGHFPDDPDELGQLPGVGAYTAAAIAAIAFDRPFVPVDGNVERVAARVFAIADPLPGGKPALRRAAATLATRNRPGDFAQALMDLGATICTPRRPRCTLCPWTGACTARRLGIQDDLPARSPKPEKPTRSGTAFWLTDSSGSVLLRRRPEKGLLGGMMEIPSSGWDQAGGGNGGGGDGAPAPAVWRTLPGEVRHTFTHFHLVLRIAVARIDPRPADIGGVWVPVEALGDHALPTVMRKVARHALRHAA